MVTTPAPGEVNLAIICEAIRQIAAGRMNNIGTVTLTHDAATTDVTNLACIPGMQVFYTPTTLNAAAEIGNGTMYTSNVTKLGFTITHANNAQTDRTFAYCLIGS